MDDLDRRLAARRAANARALAAFGGGAVRAGAEALERIVRRGRGPTLLHTIGYEKRAPEDLVAALRGAGVRVLVDVRDDPASRRPEYRPAALRALAEGAGLVYEPRRDLGAPKASRDALRASGDLARYLEGFRAHAEAALGGALERLARRVAEGGAALLCYERIPEDCHRSVLADIVATRLDATVVAIL